MKALKFVFYLIVGFCVTMLILTTGVPTTQWSETPYHTSDLSECTPISSTTSSNYGSCSSGDSIYPCEQFQGMNLFDFTLNGQSLLFRKLEGISQKDIKYRSTELDAAGQQTLNDLLTSLAQCGYRSEQTVTMSDERDQRYSVSGDSALFYDDLGNPVCQAEEKKRKEQTHLILNCLHSLGNSGSKSLS